MTKPQRYIWFLLLTLVSACALAYEVSLVALLNIVQWSHFSFMIISLALLGFAASGSYLALLKIKSQQYYSQLFFFHGLLFAVSSLLCFLIAEHIPFNALTFMWDPWQMIHLVCIYLTLGVPFFFAANCVGISLFQFHQELNIAYAFDLLGAALGCIAVIALLYLMKPLLIPTTISAIAFFGSILFSLLFYKQLKYILVGLCATFILLLIMITSPYYQLSPAPSKPMIVQLHTVGAKKIYEKSNPLGLVTVVSNQTIPFRYAPGISLYNKTDIAPQLGVYTNYDDLQVITNVSSNYQKIQYLDYMTNALAYHLLTKPRVLLFDVGTGASTLLALYHHASTIDQTQKNSIIQSIMNHTFFDYSGAIFSKAHTTMTQPRTYLLTHSSHYDLIDIPLTDSVAMKNSSIYSGDRGYLFTIESFTDMFKHLHKNGMIQITQRLHLPPQNSAKLVALTLASLKQLNITAPQQHIALIRGWKTLTLLIKKTRFNQKDRQAIRYFCQQRGFDTVYYSTIQQKETNQYNVLSQPLYYQITNQLIKNFSNTVKHYKYNITPNTDNQPFFFSLFKWQSLKEIWQLRRHAHGLLDWGYLLNLMTLAQSILFSVVLVFLPIFLIHKKRLLHRRSAVLATVFSLIGLAYMLTEINYIQRMHLYFSSTVVVVSIVIASFLMYSAIGSALTKKLLMNAKSHRFKFYHVMISIILLNILYLYALPSIMHMAITLGFIPKALITSALIAPLAFFMGMPFPYYLTNLTQQDPSGIAIAWATNGCASVIASIGSAILALSIGFNAVIILAIVLYALSGYVYTHGNH